MPAPEQEPLEGEPGSTGDGTPPRGARLVLFTVADRQYAGRSKRRERILAMRPVDPTETARPTPAGKIGGRVFWEYLQADDDPEAVRTRDLPDEPAGRDDAARIFAAAKQLRIVYVRDPQTDQLAWWLVLGHEVVLVPARVWASTQRTAVARDAKRARTAMATMPPWGEYHPF